MPRPRSLLLLLPLVVVLACCGRCPGGLFGELAPIKGTRISPLPAYPSSAQKALTLAEDAVVRATSGDVIQSWEGDPPDEVRSYTWDLVAMAAALHGKLRHRTAHQRIIAELIKRELAGGAWPELTIKGADPSASHSPGHSESAAALTLLASLASEGLVIPGLAERIRRGQAWLEGAWRPDGGLPIVPGSRRLSTEGTALALMAGLALGRGCSWCEDRALEAARLLAGTLWVGDHFARGQILGFRDTPDTLDQDSTGPHTHTTLAVLALLEARRVLGKRAPDPARFNPLPWLDRHFTRTARVGSGVTVQGLGGRQVLQDRSGLLYGCVGGEVARQQEQPVLRCPTDTLRMAEPITCATPYLKCGTEAAAIPAGARPVETVDAQVSLLAALAATGLGDTKRAAALISGALAMQLPGGAVMAVAGPPRSAPDSALRYPLFHPVAQYGVTGLLVTAMEGRNPFSPSRALGKGAPAGVSLPPASARKQEAVELGLLPEPVTGWVAAAGPDLLHLQAQTRPEGWVTWATPFRGDLLSPAACWTLRMKVSGEGPWHNLQVKAEDARGVTYGLNLPGMAAGGPDRLLEIPLDRLALFWLRGGDPGATFRPGRFSLGVTTRGARGPAGKAVMLKARGLRLLPGDCTEGGAVSYRRGQVEAEGAGGRPPGLKNVEVEGKRALKVTYDVSGPDAWQRITVNGRWRWRCARAIKVRYRADQRTRVQLVLEDGQLGKGYKKGARFFVEGFLNKTNGWREWRASVGDLRPFDPKDLRLLDGARLRKLAIAFPSVKRAAQKGTVLLKSLEALAPPDTLDDQGRCK